MRKRQNEEKIYEVALKQFSKYGFKKTTLDDIAEELNMTNANLYGYAASKQALYHDSVAYALSRWLRKVESDIKDIEDPVELLTVLCDSSVMYLSADKIFTQILQRDPDIIPLFPTANPYSEIRNQAFMLLRNTLELGVKQGRFNEINVDSCTRILFGVFKAMIIETYIKKDETFFDSYRAARDIVLYGIIK